MVPHGLSECFDKGLALLLQVLEQLLRRAIVVPADLVPVLDAVDGSDGTFDGLANGLAVLHVRGSLSVEWHRAGVDSDREGGNGDGGETHFEIQKRVGSRERPVIE